MSPKIIVFGFVTELTPRVTVIVPVKNEAKRIRACLDSLTSQTYDDYEIVVVDDESTDGTVDIISSYIREFPHKIRLLFSPSRGTGYAKNLGAKKCERRHINLC